MRLCLVGNSHLVCVKEAVDRVGGIAGADLSWFYAPGLALGRVTVTGGVLRSSDADAELVARRNARVDVDLAEHDAFVIVGLRLHAHAAARTFARFRVWGDPADGRTLVSEDAFVAAVAGQLRATLAAQLASSLRAHTDRRILLVAQPSPSIALLDGPAGTAREARVAALWRDLADPEIGRRVYDRYVSALDALASELDAEVVPQPPETLTGAFTGRRFQRAPDDFRHGDEAYGQAVLAAVTTALA